MCSGFFRAESTDVLKRFFHTPVTNSGEHSDWVSSLPAKCFFGVLRCYAMIIIRKCTCSMSLCSCFLLSSENAVTIEIFIRALPWVVWRIFHPDCQLNFSPIKCCAKIFFLIHQLGITPWIFHAFFFFLRRSITPSRQHHQQPNNAFCQFCWHYRSHHWCLSTCLLAKIMKARSLVIIYYFFFTSCTKTL